MSAYKKQPAVSPEVDEVALRGELTERLVNQRHASVGNEQRDLLVLEARFLCQSLPSRIFTWLGTQGLAFRGDGQTLLMLRISFGRLQLFSEFTAAGELFAEEKSLAKLDRLSMGVRLLPLAQLVPALARER
jgi:hypothetical protein